MEIDEIVDYATKSPENTNPAVLRSMLSQLNSGGSGGALVVHFTYDEEKSDLEYPVYVYSSDKTIDEIRDAAESGQLVYGFADFSDSSDREKTQLVLGSANRLDLQFTSAYLDWDTLNILTLSWIPDIQAWRMGNRQFNAI